MPKGKNIRELDPGQLEDVLTSRGEPPFRARQVNRWIWEKGCRDFDTMTNLPLSLRNDLSREYEFWPARIKDRQFSEDGTVKFAFGLHDGYTIEGVLIPDGKRMTACVSSQVGCSLTCRFCATRQLERKRNVRADEIFDQVFLIDQNARELFDRPLSNVVFMGMGEPLLNYANVLKAISRISGKKEFNFSPRRITVSTVGIAKMIERLGSDNPKVNLALSLHVANDEKRKHIMPVTKSNTLEKLKEAVKAYYKLTGNRITYEYTLLNEINDQPEDAGELAEFCKITPCKINLIEYNTVDHTGFSPSPLRRTLKFKEYLESKNLVVNIRRSRGKDIDAACGQLANKKG